MKRLAATCAALVAIGVIAYIYPHECYHVLRVLAVGWLAFLRHRAGLVEVNGVAIATGAVFIVLLFLALHAFARHCYRGTASSPGRRWRWRWTCSAVLALALMFTVGYTTIGLARHIGWLCTSGKPLLEEHRVARD
jgi:hypothetical protein